MPRLISFCGLFVLIGLAWLMSSHKRRFPWRVVIGGLGLQLTFGVVILKTDAGRVVFQWLGDRITNLLNFVDQGAGFVFGPKYQDFYFAFKVLPTIIFFSALMSLLYHFGVMQMVTRVFAVLMQKTLGTSGAETLAAAANIFVGQTEAPLVIRPYVASMTQSELMAVMVGGFANVAGGVLAAYVGMGINAVHLIASSVISAPASLLLAKVLQPEVDHPKTLGKVSLEEAPESTNALHAASMGAADGVKLALNVGGMLIAFLALIALANALFAWCGGLFGMDWSLSGLLSYVFAPVAFVLGVESKDCLHVGQLLGIKIVGNEFIAYEQLSKWLAADSSVHLSERSTMLVTYALCGFANFGSIGIQIGGIGPLAPEREPDLARLGLRAMLGGALASCMTACIAGVLV
ncbi:MAG: NupC/NupG family nucleoside CNT transporter [Planctomycetales bacterium]|nr:NupC/NupG family nucleoside CNT transporter [Planctomycetales bacterium]